MLQWIYEGDNLTMIDAPAPAPISLVDLIRGTLSEPESGGIYNNFGPTGNDWSVGAFGGTPVPLVFNYQGNAPADVLAAFGSASPLLVSQVTDPNSPLNNRGGSDFSNLLLGASFVTGGALLTGGSGLFSTVFDSISNAVSSVLNVLPEASSVLGAAEAQTFTAGAYASGLDLAATAVPAAATVLGAAEAQTFTAGAYASGLDLAATAVPAAATVLGAAEAQTFTAGAYASGLDLAATAVPATAVPATVGAITLSTAADFAKLAATAAALTKSATGVAAAGALAAHPMAAFSTPLVLGNGSDALPGKTFLNSAAAPAAPDAGTSNYAAFAIAGVALLGIYVFIVRKQ